MSVSEFKCPVCGEAFKSIKVRDVKLIPLETDRFMRVRYRDVEPLYYEITSCPKCRYTAQTSMYDKLLLSRKKMILEKLAPYLPELRPYHGESPDSGDVFERYYLSLLCAETGFSDHQMITAGLWMKLSRVYADAGDEAMELYAAKKAQEEYIEAFQKVRIQPIKFPSLFLIIGAMSMKVGDLHSAREFLFKVKVDGNSTRVQKDQADDFINEMREQIEDDGHSD